MIHRQRRETFAQRQVGKSRVGFRQRQRLAQPAPKFGQNTGQIFRPAMASARREEPDHTRRNNLLAGAQLRRLSPMVPILRQDFRDTTHRPDIRRPCDEIVIGGIDKLRPIRKALKNLAPTRATGHDPGRSIGRIDVLFPLAEQTELWTDHPPLLIDRFRPAGHDAKPRFGLKHGQLPLNPLGQRDIVIVQECNVFATGVREGRVMTDRDSIIGRTAHEPDARIPTPFAERGHAKSCAIVDEHELKIAERLREHAPHRRQEKRGHSMKHHQNRNDSHAVGHSDLVATGSKGGLGAALLSRGLAPRQRNCFARAR